MGFNIREIKATIDKHSYLKAHSYDVFMDTPNIMRNERLSISTELNRIGSVATDQSIGDIPRILQVRAEETTLPGDMIITTDNNRYGIGPSIKNPSNILFTDTSMTFMADKYGLLWAYFYLWKNKIFRWDEDIDPKKTVPPYTVAYRKTKAGDNYVTDIIVTMYDVENIPRMKFKLIGAYPTMVPSTPVAWGATDQLLKLHVNFTFHRWVMMDINSSDVGARQLPTTIDQWSHVSAERALSTSTPDTSFTTR